MAPPEKIRVLHIGVTLGMGGGETWLLELMKYWHQGSAVQMDLLLTSGQKGIFDARAEALGAKLYYLPYRREKIGAFISQYRSILRQGGYHALHDHSDYATGWRYLMAQGVLPPVRVTHVHNPWLHIAANYAVSPTRKLAAQIGKSLVLHQATHICGTSSQILREYGFQQTDGRGPQVSSVHCGIDVGKFNAPREGDRAALLEEFGWGPDAKVVLFAGRLDRAMEFDHPQNHKNSWFALNVVKAALERDPTIRLLMAGDGNTIAPELERAIEAWGFSDQMRLIGIRHDIPELMRGADLLFFPSRQEGLGMVAVEAQAAGLRVLASTAVPAEAIVMPELYTALSLDAPINQWAETLIGLAGRPKPSLDASRRALEQSAFSIATSAAALEKIYRSR